MNDFVDAEEAQRQWLSLLGLVARGSRFTITTNGRPVAMLVPAESEPRDVSAAIAQLRAERAGRSLGGISIRELIEVGRRERPS